MLSLDGCRARQRRLLAEMAKNRFDLLVTANYRTIYYFTGQLLPADAPCAFLSWADGQTAWSRRPLENALADEKRQVSVYTPERAIPLPHQDARAIVDDLLAQRPASRVGVDRTSTESPAILNISGEDASSWFLNCAGERKPMK